MFQHDNSPENKAEILDAFSRFRLEPNLRFRFNGRKIETCSEEEEIIILKWFGRQFKLKEEGNFELIVNAHVHESCFQWRFFPEIAMDFFEMFK
uniref:Uncharacterized protein n=1 Tax=Caenorhabditis tropicalis TaxID=1561998 RepID=A0A1I7UQY6_9PELO